MIIWLGLRWWYGSGWYWIIERSLIERSRRILGVFSVKALLSTLFSPYRQTFAGEARGSIGDKLRAFFDKTISRVIGLIIRLLIIITGLVTMIFALLLGLLMIIFWPLLPLMPIVSIVFISLGGK